MVELAKFISKDIGDLSKLFGIEKGNLSKILKTDVPSAAAWWSRYTWKSGGCFYGVGECNMGNWYFVASCSDIVVTEEGTWSDAYRPTKVRITHDGTGTGLRIYVKDKNGATIGDSGNNYSSGDEITLTWGSYDLSGFRIDNFDTYGLQFTNVEWQSDVEPASCGGGGGE